METISRGSDGRRLFTAEFKRTQFDRLPRGEITASELSREMGVPRSLIQKWKYLATRGAETAVGSNDSVVPLGELGAPQLYGLARPVRGRRRRGRRHEGQVECVVSNQRWCTDVLEIASWNSEVVHVVFAVDCCDREAIAFVATPYSTSAVEVRRLIRKAVFARSGDEKPDPPVQWLSDNEAIYTSLETVVEAERHHLMPITTPVTSPESNGMTESFVNTFKRDYVAGGDLSSAARLIEHVDGWIKDYNTFAPHSSLGMKTPAAFRLEHQTVADTGCLTK